MLLAGKDECSKAAWLGPIVLAFRTVQSLLNHLEVQQNEFRMFLDQLCLTRDKAEFDMGKLLNGHEASTNI